MGKRGSASCGEAIAGNKAESAPAKVAARGKTSHAKVDATAAVVEQSGDDVKTYDWAYRQGARRLEGHQPAQRFQ